MKFATLATVAVVFSGADALKVTQQSGSQISLEQKASIQQME